MAISSFPGTVTVYLSFFRISWKSLLYISSYKNVDEKKEIGPVGPSLVLSLSFVFSFTYICRRKMWFRISGRNETIGNPFKGREKVECTSLRGIFPRGFASLILLYLSALLSLVLTTVSLRVRKTNKPTVFTLSGFVRGAVYKYT